MRLSKAPSISHRRGGNGEDKSEEQFLYNFIRNEELNLIFHSFFINGITIFL
jgi:hypothetical protein